MTDQALQKLLEGNRRFVENKSQLDGSEKRRREIATGQHPFATILGCVDSRVPPELIFDQGLGELFVIRTAGEVLDQAVLGSIEFGVEELKIPLLVVLGHKNCGAIKATREVLHTHSKAEADIEYLVQELTLAVEIGDEGQENPVDRAVRAQVCHVVERLWQAPILKPAVQRGELKIVGAYYDLDSGLVEMVIE
jgi:carbonic anhydrase